MKFFFYSSVILLIIATILGIITLLDRAVLITLLYLQFGLGCLHFLSTLVALAKFRLHYKWFVIHLCICLGYLCLLTLSGLNVTFTEEFIVVVVFIIPWLIALYHTVQLQSTVYTKRVNILDI